MQSLLGHVTLASIVASLLAIVPFWTPGLTLSHAAEGSAAVFPIVIVSYALLILRK